jgi:hypothetical protein
VHRTFAPVRIIATAAALFLFSTDALANVVEFQVIQGQSSLTQSLKLVGPAVGGSKTATPQAAGSDVTNFFGSMFVDVQETTIQLLPGAYISAAATGAYAPFDPISSAPNPASPGVNQNSNYGFVEYATGLLEAQYNLRIDNGWSGAPSIPMPLAGENFNLAGQAMSFSAGRQATISYFGNESHSVIGDRFVLFGSAGSDIGTWDGLILTLPVHSYVSFVVTNEFGGVSEFVSVSGQLVLTPKVPEPSAAALLGLAVAALLGCAWRTRAGFGRHESRRDASPKID